MHIRLADWPRLVPNRFQALTKIQHEGGLPLQPTG